MLQHLYMGFWNSLAPMNMIALLAGMFAGTVGGAIPGISGTMMVAIVIPLTYGMEPTAAIIFLIGIYVGSVFSGSFTAILSASRGPRKRWPRPWTGTN